MLGVRSRSFHAPHGVTVNGPAPATSSSANSSAARKLKRKFSWSSPRLRKASSEGLLTHRPVVLKEGYLCKPTFFRFGGKKRRWCVLRTYTQSEASLDIYMDETKERYKGSISLDRDSNPIFIVKNAEGKKKSAKQCYLSLKVAKHTHQFTTESFRELKEWCALLRQAMDNGNTFSGRVMEPVTLGDGMANLRINSNCITLLCPINEQKSLKTWRLDRITSFGQSAGNLTFECCSVCGDPSATRCSVSLIQEKPTTILNILERAIRSNPNTNEIHYERSILGDIYHCNHECGHGGRLIPAFSDPNLYRSASVSPFKGLSVALPVAMDFNDSDGIPSSTMHSNDSGLPSTPPADENGSLTSSLHSPSGSSASSVHGHDSRVSASPFRSPKHSISSQQYPHSYHVPPELSKRSMSDNWRSNGQPGDHWRRRQSDEVPGHVSHMPEHIRRTSDDHVASHVHDQHIYDQPHEQYVPQESPKRHKPRLTYAMISHELPPKLIRRDNHNGPPSPVMYATINPKFDVPPPPPKERYDRLQPVDEMHETDQVIYDVPNCEPGSSMPFSPPQTPPHRPRKKSTSSSSSGAQSQSDRESSVFRSPARIPQTSTAAPPNSYYHGSDVMDRTEDFEELPPAVPTRHRRQRPVKEHVTLKSVPVNIESSQPYRRRLQSSSEVLDSGAPRRPLLSQMKRCRGSMDNLDQVGREQLFSSMVNGWDSRQDRRLKGSTDLLARLQEEEDKLSKVLKASRRERNEELIETKDRVSALRRPLRYSGDNDYDEPDPDTIMETSSNLLDYRSHLYSAPSNVDKVLTKVASDNVRGYAYKVAIPVANTQYDVPRKAAPAPDLSNIRNDAPPKPRRFTSPEYLY